MARGQRRAGAVDRRTRTAASRSARFQRDVRSAPAQVANYLRALGVRRGDRVLLMLGNELALWEAMLACIKLGAVLIPATALLTTEDLRDRIERGEVRHVIAASAPAPASSPTLAGDYTPHRVGEPQPGWQRFAGRRPRRRATSRPTGRHAGRPTRCCCTSPPAPPPSPSWCCTRHQSYPVGHLSTMYWIGLQPGDMHLNISSPGWAKHAWSCFFAPWNAGACVFIHNTARFNAAGAAGDAGALRRHQPVRAAHRVAHADPGGPGRLPRAPAAARAGRRRRAAEPRDHRAGARRLGPDAARRLRPDRDHRPGRQHARPAAEARLHGPAAAGLPHRAARRRRQARPTRARSCIDLADRARPA